jgi:hypothetical protein
MKLFGLCAISRINTIFKGNYFEEFWVKPEMEATLGALCFNIGGIKEPHFFIYYRIYS